ncbi:hypothetical protein [Pedobacter nyackensis]|uniref:hypothetical protein n=1 Tax=Pedobacter nyackensis TaxID=475255 RepID=UPI00292F126B|nr:hypothetical protein [Pedobacter nyackensis]
MKQKLTISKLLIMTILLLSSSLLKAQLITSSADFTPAPGAIYCNGTHVKISATADPTAVSYKWYRYPGTDKTTTPVELSATTLALDDDITTPGYFTYVAVGISASLCESTVSDPITVYVLPGITASITAPSLAEYCENALPTGPAAITLNAVAGKVGTVSETFAYNYEWLKDGTPISGAPNSASYTLDDTNDIAPGTHNYTVKITYKVKACTATTSAAQAIKVNPKANKPVISITP